MSDHQRMKLNNVLQQYRTLGSLTWEEIQQGPLHDPTWTAIAYLNEIEWGRGTGRSRGAAKEQAAGRVLAALVSDGKISD